MDTPTKFIPTRSKSTTTLPERPLSSYSMASTIRRVISSEDDSFTEELKENAVAHSTPKPRRRNSSAEMEIMRPSAPTPAAGVRGAQTEALPRRDAYVMHSTLMQGNQARESPPKPRDPRPFSMPTAVSYQIPNQSIELKSIREPRPTTPTPMPRSHRRSRYQYNHPADYLPDFPSLINDPNDPDRVDATKKADSKDGPATPVQTLFGTAGTEFYKKTDCENGSPFHGAKTVGELQEERRKVSGGTEAGKSGKGCCGGGCDIM